MRVDLPPTEASHARVLRLRAGVEVELFDGRGRAWRAVLDPGLRSATLKEEVSAHASGEAPGPALVLATAWPKGKRAAFLVEKCTELGVSRIVPVNFERSVVLKQAGSQGLARLQRIAAEAAKQAARTTVPEIEAPVRFEHLLQRESPRALLLLLDPRAETPLIESLTDAAPLIRGQARPVILIVGPEGGFTDDELACADEHAVRRVRLGRHVLRVETAAVAACAVCAACLQT